MWGPAQKAIHVASGESQSERMYTNPMLGSKNESRVGFTSRGRGE